jgi:signal transduction histidine kinase/ligand-binding sensor domain-containing protein
MKRPRTLPAVGAILACCFPALALNPALDISQYAHNAWTIRDGDFKGAVEAIAQTPDGYLWLGTEFGLLRFDGVRRVAWQPPPDQNLPSSEIHALLVTTDGTLWIGTSEGLASWEGGKLTRYPEFAGHVVAALLEDHEGSVWAGDIGVPAGKLCAIRKGSVLCYGEDGSFGLGVESLYEYKGSLWVGAANGLSRWKPSPPDFYPKPDPLGGVSALISGDNGALWIATRGGIEQLVDGKVKAYPLPVAGNFHPYRLLRDREGSLWIATSNRGLWHLHRGRIDVFGSADGLTGEDIQSLFEDREGNIWVGTREGLDRFREYAVSTISSRQGLSTSSVYAVLAARDGSVWLGTPDGLNRWKDGQVTVYRKGNGSSPTGRAQQHTAGGEVSDSGLADNDVGSLLQDDRGRIWIATTRGLASFEDGRFISVSSVPRQIVRSIAEEGAGSLWIADQDHGLFHWFGEKVVEGIPWATLGHRDFASALAADRVKRGLWLGFYQGDVAYFNDGLVRASYTTADGLGRGHVNDLRLDRDGALWAATEGGLSRVKNGRIATLTSSDGLPCDAVRWSTEDDDHSVWLYMACGLVRVARPEFDAWAADSRHKIKTTVFDSSDGVRSIPHISGFSPAVAKSPDGKLWFAFMDGVSVVDPRHLPLNKLPPPVHIEEVKVDGKVWDSSHGWRLPALVRDVTIRYTALSFAAPEKVHFRYKLEGQDPDWKEVVHEREAPYTNLKPRNYRFRVMASNNSGAWNETGDTLEFSIAPTFYQTNWFGASLAAVFAAILWGLYRLRLYQVAREFSVQTGERARIARDLHDTLLQSFHASLIQMQTARNVFPRRPEEGIKTLDNAIGSAEQAIDEGRRTIQDLRATVAPRSNLEHLLTAAAQELAEARDSNGAQPVFDVTVEGAERTLAPDLQDEVYRTGREVLRNAFRHAQASHIEAEIRYDRHHLRLRIRDDGKGIDRNILEEGAKAGHWGLTGIRERAKRIGGQFDIWSEAGAGTEIQLTVPASRAYAQPQAHQRFGMFRKKTGVG